MKTELLQILQSCQEKNTALIQMIDLKQLNNRIAEIDELMVKNGFWNDQKKAAELTKERSLLTSRRLQINTINDEVLFLSDYTKEFPAEIETIEKQINDLASKIEELELQEILKEEHDKYAAIISITSGAGGLEACNFNKMLTRMFLRYCDSRGLKSEILDEKPSEEYAAICQDSITFRVEGEYAYGYLKTCSGVFRLIRNSPFNSGAARHTSFCGVSVIPDVDDKIEVEIEEKDLEWDVMRAGGKGGQSVNRTNSAVRIRHIPSGITIRVQNEKSQHENRRIALQLLKAKLFDIELKKQEQEKNKVLSSLADKAFANQDLTITLSPYALVKCHHSNYESNQPDKFLDGELQEFIITNLHHR